MKNSIKILFLALLFIVTSCRSSEEVITETPVQDNFFNLDVGNKYVYKTYENFDFTDPNSVTVFTGRTDSVSIVQKIEVNGLIFSKERTKTIWPNSNQNNKESFRYLRVNSKGHLIALNSVSSPDINETSGAVVHPGEDLKFTFTRDFIDNNQVIGSLFYQLEKGKNIDLEGTPYLVAPYMGVFTPAPSQPDLLKKVQEISFKKGLGLVKEICHVVYGKGYLETRLVSSEVIK